MLVWLLSATKIDYRLLPKRRDVECLMHWVGRALPLKRPHRLTQRPKFVQVVISFAIPREHVGEGLLRG